MDFNLSDEQQMLVENARRYVRERCGVAARRDAQTNGIGFSRQRWADFATLGWLALPLSEDAGGLGGSDVDLALLAEELGRGLTPEPFIDTAVLCASLLEKSTTDALRRDLLTRLMEGELVLALAHMEPGGRSELDTAPTTRAEACAGDWRLSGAKHLVVHGAVADHYLVTAKIQGQEEFSLFLIPRDAPGLEYHEYALIDGSRAVDLQLNGVNVSESALLLPAAASALQWAVTRALVAATAAAIGSMEAVMEATASYLKTREQYGRPLAQFQALQHRVAEMLVETDRARSGLYAALAKSMGTDQAAYSRAVSGAKSIAARAVQFVTAQGIQLHGGVGVTEEFAVGHHYKSALVYDKRFGDAEYHLARWANGQPLP